MLHYIQDIIELIKVSIIPPKKQKIPLNKFGLNAFFNRPELGNIVEQSKDINSMGIKLVRVLFNWNDDIQKSRNASINFSFYDDIINKIPQHFRLMVVLNGAPSWLDNSKDTHGDFLQYVKAVAERYKDKDVVWGYQIGNETNQDTRENNLYGFSEPSNYISLVRDANAVIKLIDKIAVVTNAATTSVIQDFDNTLRYNRLLVTGGILDHVDAYSFHYYGDSYLNFYRPNGAYRLLKAISAKKSLILTEFGTNEPSKHLQYAQEKLPYLLKKFPNIVAAFWYQYDGSGTTVDYGLRPRETNLYTYLKSH